MKTRTSNRSNLKDSPATIEAAAVGEYGPTVLTERELDMVAAAGGRGGLSGDVRLRA
jgi:hypothetical protein